MYFVYVHNNNPAYEGDNVAEALRIYNAEVAKSFDGVGPSEIIELWKDDKQLDIFVPEDDSNCIVLPEDDSNCRRRT